MSSPLPRRVPKPHSPKRCLKCHEWLPIECFDRKANSPDFHSTECKACKLERKEPTRLVREEKLRIALRGLLEAIHENEAATILYNEHCCSFDYSASLYSSKLLATRKALKEAKVRAARLVE